LNAKIATLTTDFGLRDPYVSTMKGVMLGICPGAAIVDITHKVKKFDISNGAFVLASAAPFFPPDTVHVVVVDPGVGTERRPIIIETKRGFFVGPDNGVMTLAAEAQGIRSVHEISSRRFMLPHVSNTFHGRDVFAPVAAHLLNGVDLMEFGPPQAEFVKPNLSKVVKTDDSLAGEVLHIDHFGNVITNITLHDLKDSVRQFLSVEVPMREIRLKLSKSYGDVKPQEPIALIGSHNFLEIALNQGSASSILKINVGDKILVRRSISSE
jgi:S-adenosylmethionine hydrolase